MATTWLLKDATGANLPHQPPSGSPLALNFTSGGYGHLPTYPTELIYLCEATETTAATVTIHLSPDDPAYWLSEVMTRPREDPSHPGDYSWTTGGDGTTTITFDVPALTSAETYRWTLGELEPPIALKMKVRVHR
ncbi:hypothetical protein SAMN02745121_08132 [Nannocystis exedens]|uniref:Uncharacterized protein n=1 Tax=Nannocystis exedens TaxID=54 RepID=A0A1I2HQJ7_9BACT|nr:hypothetical protein [Nannocystis exedens]PCC69412.1 hypothetical protein NAEX_02434 [Nannocystis exedens]SFF32099.1 hypothetical protein SAMN02745121_08132 [Nannocystis exedens]